MTIPLVLAALVAALPTHDSLQVRRGLFIGVGLGPAALIFHCRACPEAGTAFATQGRIRVGTTVGSHLTLGLDVWLWRRQSSPDGGVTTTATCTVYPDADGGTFIQAGIGRTAFQGLTFAEGPDERGSGPAALLSIGYDARFDRKLSLTPLLTVAYTSIGSTHILALPQRRGVNLWLAALTVGFTWH